MTELVTDFHLDFKTFGDVKNFLVAMKNRRFIVPQSDGGWASYQHAVGCFFDAMEVDNVPETVEDSTALTEKTAAAAKAFRNRISFA